ncbi:uncharacterized protein LOC113515684 [Galleria mellonella]|uniref:Uncharacterized protein LOC113515684 n=1 Tax=Galleria mellonella TaxID=7137 RepID=A0A6J3C2N6_GALME|nr:uncharacterized protein LOC113515684 [Galleria mellonella]
MKTRIIALGKTISKLFEPRTYATHPVRCDAHMNELPVPCGPWELWYKDRQSYYNKVLFAGVSWWLFSLFMVIYTESIFLNWGPPAQPGPPSDMVEECDDSDI